MSALTDYEATILRCLEEMSAGNLDEAIALAEQAYAEHPDGAEVCCVLGLIAERRSDQGLAIKFIERAHAIDPDTREYADALAVLHAAVGHITESIYYAKLALALDPHPTLPGLLPPDYKNLSLTLQHTAPSGHYIQALAAFTYGDLDAAAREAEAELRINPRHFEATRLLAETLLLQRKLETAVHFAHAAIHLNPGDATSRLILADALRGSGRSVEADACYRTACRMARSAEKKGEILGRGLAGLAAGASDLSALDGWLDAWHAASAPKRVRPATEFMRKQTILIGIIGNCFFEHSYASILFPLFRLAGDHNLSFVVYQQNRRSDIVTTRMRAGVMRWREVYDIDDATLARIIRNDELDLLIDVGGLGDASRPGLLAYKPAPVVARWLGWPGPWRPGSGEVTIVQDSAAGLVTAQGGVPMAIPGVAFPYEFRSSDPLTPEPGSLPFIDCGVITFGGVLDVGRLHPETIALWAEVLGTVPGSRLFLGYQPSLEVSIRERILELFGHFGLVDRVFLQAVDTSGDAKLGFFATIDIMFETEGMGSAVETADALWMGVPVLALKRPRYLGPDAASVLRGLGLADFIAEDADRFVAKAVELVQDTDALAKLRAGLRQRLVDAGVEGNGFITRLCSAISTHSQAAS